MEDETRRQLIESQRAHKLRLRELERRAALLGMNVPPEVTIEIADLQKVVVDLNRQLGPTAPRTLPAPPTDFVGRAREVEQLVQQVDQALRHGNKAIVCVRGMGGVGKTALVYSAARHLEARFPDGQLLVDLRHMGDAATPAEALQVAIRAMSEATRLPDDPGELEGVYRTCLAGKRVLILADDAQDAAQVRPLTPPEGCALLITSRNRFALPGMAPLDLDVLAPAAAETLLLTICPRIGDYAARLARLCGQLPLALRLSAGLLACDGTRNVARYVAGLKAKRLNELSDPDDPSASVEAALRLSYDMLEADQRWMLCQLDVFPASFDLAAAEAIVGGAGLEDLLGALHRRCLLAWDAAAERYDLHVLVRAFVRARQPAHESVRLRHAQYYAELARRARRLVRQEGDSRRDGLALLDREWAHIDAGWAWAHQQDGQAVCAELLLAYTEATLAVVDRYYGFDQRLMLLEQALRLAWQSQHAAIQAPLLVKLGDTLVQLNDTAAHLQNMEQALTWYCEAATIARDHARPRDWWSECRAWIGMGMAQARKGEHMEAIWASMQGLSIARDFGYRHEICLALSNLGNAYVERGRMWDAIACYEEALQVALRLDDCRIGVKLLRDLGAAYQVLAYAEGQDAPPHHYLQQAEAYYRQSGELARQIGDLWGASATYWRQDELSLSLEDHEASAGLDPVGHLGCPQQDQG